MQWYWRKYFILTLALTTFLLVSPLLALSNDTSLIEEIVFMILMLTTLHTVAHNKTLLIIGMALTLITLWGTLTTTDSTHPSFLISLISAITLLSMVVLVVIFDVILSKEILVDTIFGAIASYLLIGVTWGLCYYLADTILPQAITINSDLTDQALQLKGESDYSFYNYFSFVTMSTLGYGDVIPSHPVTRALATYQAVFGQMFIAILVARLVSMHLTNRKSD